MRTVKINGREMKVRNTLRAFFIFEEIKERKFEVKTLMDYYLFLYCVLLANNPEENLGWEEFIEALDKRPELGVELAGLLKEKEEIDALTEKGDEEGEGEKKK